MLSLMLLFCYNCSNWCWNNNLLNFLIYLLLFLNDFLIFNYKIRKQNALRFLVSFLNDVNLLTDYHFVLKPKAIPLQGTEELGIESDFTIISCCFLFFNLFSLFSKNKKLPKSTKFPKHTNVFLCKCILLSLIIMFFLLRILINSTNISKRKLNFFKSYSY